MAKIAEFRAPKKTQEDVVIPNSFAELIDELGAAVEFMKPLKKMEKGCKDRLKLKVEVGKDQTRTGKLFTANFKWGTRKGLDVDQIRKDMGPEWCKKYETSSNTLTITTKRK